MKTKEYRNFKTTEEAIEIFNNNVEQLNGDYLAFYILPKEEKVEDELIDIIDSSNIKTEVENSDSLTVIAKGELATRYDIGDRLIVDPRGAMNYITVMFEDCLYLLLSEKAFVIKLK